MTTTKLKRFFILAILLSIFVGIAFGILLQYYHIPGGILADISSHLDRPASSVVDSNRSIMLKTRTFKAAIDEEKFDTEKDSYYIYNSRKLDMGETVLILIDVWAHHPNEGWLERAQEHTKLKIVPLLELARKHNMTIIHAPHSEEIAKEAKPLPNELVIDSWNELDNYLKDHRITTLLYAGYASNWCVINRPEGIITMRASGYKPILIRDCTIAFESPETLDDEWANKVAIYMVESLWGETTTLEDMQEALGVYNEKVQISRLRNN